MSEKVHTLTLGELVSLIFACFLIGLIVVFVFVAIVAIIAFRRRYMSEPKNEIDTPEPEEIVPDDSTSLIQ